MRPLTEAEVARLRERLRLLGGTKQDAADRLGVSRFVVERALKGEKLQLAKRIALVGKDRK